MYNIYHGNNVSLLSVSLIIPKVSQNNVHGTLGADEENSNSKRACRWIQREHFVHDTQIF